MKTTMRTKNEKIEDFLKGLEIDNLEVMDFINIDEIDFSNAFQSIYEMIDSNGGFNVEVIYYPTAIKFLSRNDPSLRDSLQLASEMGYNLYDISSEVLASLLASEMCRDDFSQLSDEIEEFFNELEEDTNE